MRALYYSFKPEELSETITIEGDAAHHLNVVRVRTGETVLVLNGAGISLQTEVASHSKKHIDLKIIETKSFDKPRPITLAVATPKKDAFEDILKMATELGVTTIAPLTSQYSQYDFAPNERTTRLLESALIQSNNHWMPEVLPQQSLTDFLKNNHSALFFFDSRPQQNSALKSEVTFPFSILIGPEGGFSEAETDQIQNTANTHGIHLPTPLLRAPTAVCAAIGYLLALAQH